MYKMDFGSSTELVFDSTSRKVSLSYDQALSKLNAIQNNSSSQPVLCNDNKRVNKQYFLKSDVNQRMLNDIDLTPVSGQPDIVNVRSGFRIFCRLVKQFCRCYLSWWGQGVCFPGNFFSEPHFLHPHNTLGKIY